MRWIERALNESIGGALARLAVAEMPDSLEAFGQLPRVARDRLRRTVVAVAAHRFINLIAAAGPEQEGDVAELLELWSPTKDPRQIYALKASIENALERLSWENDERRALELARGIIARQIIN